MEYSHPPIAVSVEFPLRGEWRAFRTPAAGAPTHGTDFLGQRYAYDFVRPTGRRWSPFGPNVFVHLFVGVPASAFRAWNAPVCAAAAGRVIRSGDDCPDRAWVHGFWNLARLAIIDRWFPVRITPRDWSALVGNHVVVESEEGVAVYAHLRRGSVRLREGQYVAAGDAIGQVGHSGRSAMPHLHFHMMDRLAFSAAGIPCGFHSFERWTGAEWQPASGYPARTDRIRGRDAPRTSLSNSDH